VAGPTLDGPVVTGVEVKGGARLYVDENVALSTLDRHDCLRIPMIHKSSFIWLPWKTIRQTKIRRYMAIEINLN